MDHESFSPEGYVAMVTEAAAFLKEKAADIEPIFCLTLGSGLAALGKLIDVACRIPYGEIPHFPTPTVSGHAGELIIGYLCGVPVIGLSGRKHYYEVATLPQAMRIVTFPVQVMASLGVKIYFSTNAAGGLDPSFKPGDLMVVTDHVDLYLPDPLLGPHLDFGGNWRFQPQHSAYSTELISMFQDAAQQTGERSNVHEGIYTARTGPTYETAAVCRVLRSQGARAVGMSVIPEVIVATNRGMETIAVSIITNVVALDGTNATSHEEVMAALQDLRTARRLEAVFSRFFTNWKATDFRE